jgi:hypothetical protein
MWSRSLFALALVGFVSMSMAGQVTDAPPQRPHLHVVLLKAIDGTRTPAIAGMTDEAEMIDLEEQDIAARRSVIHEALKTWTPEQKAHAGVIVTIGRDGDVEVMRGLVRDEDRKAIAAVVRSKGAKEHRDPDDAGDDDEGAPAMSVAPERRAPGCSDALTQRLVARRTMALQAMLAQNTAVALASVVHVFVLRTFGADYPREASALQVRAQLSAFALEAMADDLKASPRHGRPCSRRSKRGAFACPRTRANGSAG